MKIKVGDLVEVIAGNDRGEQGKVLTVNAEKNRVVVEGVNQVYKHIRRSQKNPQGGRLSKEMPIAADNVMALCPETRKKTRIGLRYREDGSKERFAKVSGASMGVISPARAQYAKD